MSNGVKQITKFIAQNAAKNVGMKLLHVVVQSAMMMKGQNR